MDKRAIRPMTTVYHSRRMMALAALSLLLDGCERSTPPAPAPVFPPAAVSVLQVVPRTLPVVWEYVGQAESSRYVEIRARVEGVLQRRTYVEGSLVHKGQVLFEMDASPFAAALQNAKASLGRQLALQANAKRNVARLSKMIAEQAISQKDLDDANTDLEQADAAVLSAQAQLKVAEMNLSYATITSPLTGLSSRAKQPEGSFVTPGSNGLLTTVAQYDPIWVNFSVSENSLLKTRQALANKQLQVSAEGNTVEIELADGSAYPHVGKLNFADSVLSPTTGTLSVRAEFKNPDGLLQPGEFVRLKVKGAVRPNAIAIPQRAIQQNQTGKFVYVVDANDKAEFRPVVVGDWYGQEWIIDSGLKAGERVIVDGMSRVLPGFPVKAEPSP